MDEHLISHFVTFTAFVQLTVAFNFGLLYLERKSSTVKFYDLFHDGFLYSIKLFLKAAGKEMKRYRGNTATTDERKAYYNVRDLRTKLTTKANALIHFKFLQPLGMVYGIFSIIQLFNICMLDRGTIFMDFFLVSGQITLLYSLIVFFSLLYNKGNNAHVLSVTFIYILLLWGCYRMIKNDWIFHCINKADIFYWFHYILLLSYLPFISFVSVLIVHYVRRVPVLWKLIQGTKELHVLMDRKCKSDNIK